MHDTELLSRYFSLWKYLRLTFCLVETLLHFDQSYPCKMNYYSQSGYSEASILVLDKFCQIFANSDLSEFFREANAYNWKGIRFACCHRLWLIALIM